MLRIAISAFMASASLTFPCNAQDLGVIEFANSCAQCHGANAKGDGPVSAYLLNPPPDLTTLSLMNDGVFPLADVYSIIDGTADVAVHGGREMPVWGDRYMSEMREDVTAHYSWSEARAYALTRVLALVEYIATIQQ